MEKVNFAQWVQASPRVNYLSISVFILLICTLAVSVWLKQAEVPEFDAQKANKDLLLAQGDTEQAKALVSPNKPDTSTPFKESIDCALVITKFELMGVVLVDGQIYTLIKQQRTEGTRLIIVTVASHEENDDIELLEAELSQAVYRAQQCTFTLQNQAQLQFKTQGSEHD